MARNIDRLTTRGLAGLPAGLHADGGGLYLRVEATGARRWTFIFRFHGQRREMGLGALGDISLAVARQLAQDARQAVKTGSNPIEARRRQRASQATMLFGELADQLIKDLASKWRNPKTRQTWETTLRVDAKALRLKYPQDIITEDIMGVLRPIWTVKPEIARLLRGRIERVLDAAKVKGLRTGENPARWKGHLALLLARPRKLTRGHHPALPYNRVGAFMADLRQSGSISAKALDFTILTNVRTSMSILARPAEFDLAENVWTVPGDRHKSGQPFRIPLSPPAAEIARGCIQASIGGWVFPGKKRGRPLSNGAMTKMLKLLGCDEFTVHGFRSTFRDWAGDRTTFARELIELAMSHALGDETEQAYWRSDALDRRRELMIAWADYCATPGGKLIRLAG